MYFMTWSQMQIKVKASVWEILITLLIHSQQTNPLTCPTTYYTHWHESSQQASSQHWYDRRGHIAKFGSHFWRMAKGPRLFLQSVFQCLLRVMLILVTKMGKGECCLPCCVVKGQTCDWCTALVWSNHRLQYSSYHTVWSMHHTFLEMSIKIIIWTAMCFTR